MGSVKMTDSTLDVYPGNVLFSPSIRLTDPDQVESRYRDRLMSTWDIKTSGTMPDYFPLAEPLAGLCRLDSRVKIQLSDMGSGIILDTLLYHRNRPLC